MTASVEAASDSQRFQGWLQELFERQQRNPEVEAISMGPFRALILPGEESGQSVAWVTLVDPDPDEHEAVRALSRLHTAFRRHSLDVEIEYDSTAFPQAARWFAEAGMIIVERNPLMAVRPETFVPFSAPHVALTRLRQHAKQAELDAFQNIRWTNGGELDREPQPVERLAHDLKTTTSVYLLAWLDWEPVGTGVSHLTGEVAEIVGVVTRNDRRRRGVAATVTSELVRRHFEHGGDFVFLDAANEEAARVYDRLGFNRFGSKVVFR
jgi:ribosomal protein S18 acetylase RimI-like enzyme